MVDGWNSTATKMLREKKKVTGGSAEHEEYVNHPPSLSLAISFQLSCGYYSPIENFFGVKS